MRCRFCYHGPHQGDCTTDNCGCVRYEPIDVAARLARQRTWLVRVSFLARQGWTPEREVRVKAAGLAGAAMKGVRAARKEALKRGARVGQCRVCIIPVARRAS